MMDDWDGDQVPRLTQTYGRTDGRSDLDGQHAAVGCIERAMVAGSEWRHRTRLDWTRALSIDGADTNMQRPSPTQQPSLSSTSLFSTPHISSTHTTRYLDKLVIMSSTTLSDVVDLNVGGVFYTTTIKTLTFDADSLLAAMFSNLNVVDGTDATSRLTQYNGRVFIDRDGVLFRYILDYLRNDGRLLLPEGFQERRRLFLEAEHFRLSGLVCALRDVDRLSAGSSTSPVRLSSVSADERGHIIVGYRGTFALGRDGGGGVADVKFRKLWRILVSGRVSLCRQVFGNTLNDSRDPDRGADDADRYSARYFLKHSFIEQAFDALLDAGFRMVGACASSTNSAGGELKPGTDVEESRWNHYNEFVFVRP